MLEEVGKSGFEVLKISFQDESCNLTRPTAVDSPFQGNDFLKNTKKNNVF
jgi:hypothetical protein